MTYSQELLYLAPEELKESPWHRRSDWGDMKALEASIRRHGLMVPIIAWDRGDGDVEIIAGVRRKRASVTCKLAEVPVLVREIENMDQLIELQVEENLQRHGLHPMDEAELFELAGTSAEKVAARHGITATHVRQRMQLCSLSKELRGRYKAGELPHVVAYAASRIVGDSLQAEAVEAMLEVMGRHPDDGLTEQLEDLCWVIRDQYLMSLDQAPFAQDDATLGRVCVGCPNRSDAQAELFPDLAPASGAYCMEKGCFDGKITAMWERAEADAKEKGLKVVAGKKVDKYSTHYLRPDRVAVWADGAGKPKTVAEVIKATKASIEPVLVQGVRGEPELCYSKKVVDQVVKEYEKKASSRKASSKSEEKTEREVRERVREAALRALHQSARGKPPGSIWLALLRCCLFAFRFSSGISKLLAAHGVQRGDIDNSADAVLSLVTSEKDARAFLVELLAMQADNDGRWGDEDGAEVFQHLCGVLQVDLKALEREIRANQKKTATKKTATKKTATKKPTATKPARKRAR